MKQLILRFVREEDGQDLVEYTLLLAFVCLGAAALFINTGKSMSNVWGDTSNVVSSADVAAQAAATAAAAAR